MDTNRTPIGYEITLVALATQAQAGNIVAFPAPAPVSLPATGYGKFAVAMAAQTENVVALPAPAPVSLPATGYGKFAVAMAARAEAEATYILAA